MSRRTAFDRWFRYPAGFSPTTLARCHEELRLNGGLLVDPFAGVATTGTWAVTNGLVFRGIEAHPFIGQIAGLKFQRLDENAQYELRQAADKIAESVQACTVPVSDEATLVRRSFTEPTLCQLVAIREHVARTPHGVAPYLRCALAATLRDVAAVRVGWPYQQPSLKRRPKFRSAAKRFRQRVGWLCEDLKSLPQAVDAAITIGDSRSRESWTRALKGLKAQVCLSSPPYLNNFDYADATRLELYFFGIVRSWAELCSVVRSEMVAATTQQSTQSRAEAGWTQLLDVPDTSRNAKALADALARERSTRPRGKEYNQTLPAYLADISAVLKNIHHHLDSNGTVAWVIGDSAPYGIYIDTPSLIARMAQELGFKAQDDILLRTRGRRWAQNGVRHQVALTERLVILTKS